jgi:hypothetical protein
MRGDVWIEKNVKGEDVLCIDTGKEISKSTLTKKYIKSVTQTNKQTKRSQK